MKVPKRRKLVLELSSVCNANCVYCGAGMRAIRKPMMPTEIATEAIVQATEIGFREVSTQMRGEPTLSAGTLDSVIRTSQKAGMVAIVYSNGSYQPTAVPDLLVWSTDWHNASLCAKMSALHFTTVRRNIRTWWARHRSLYPYRQIVCRMTKCRENARAEAKIRAYWEPYCHKFVVMPEFPLVRDVKGFKADHRAECQMPEEQLAMLSDGRVVACCTDHEASVVLGKFPEQPLREILESKEFAEFKRRIAAKEWYPICERCGFRDTRRKR